MGCALLTVGPGTSLFFLGGRPGAERPDERAGVARELPEERPVADPRHDRDLVARRGRRSEADRYAHPYSVQATAGVVVGQVGVDAERDRRGRPADRPAAERSDRPAGAYAPVFTSSRLTARRAR